MRILMATNTYLPHVGGVAESVRRYTEEYRNKGHDVLILAPEYEGRPERETGVQRTPAIKDFAGSGFSLSLPAAPSVRAGVDAFSPDIVHSHHPYFLGNTALRTACRLDIPIIFTHHTFYEHYLHYAGADYEAFRRFIIEWSTSYANLCSGVIAPSGSVMGILKERGVSSPIEVIPTGVDTEGYSKGDGGRIRSDFSIPRDTPVIGHVGRLAPEKNLDFLARSVCQALEQRDSFFLLVGEGPSLEEVQRFFHERGLSPRLSTTGVLKGRDLVDAYHAMNVFAFPSKTETQGMVLVEAMAAGVPVVTLEAPGSRDIVDDGHDGRIVRQEEEELFARSLLDVLELPQHEYAQMQAQARLKASEYTVGKCASKALNFYEDIRQDYTKAEEPRNGIEETLERLEQEWEMWSEAVSAAGTALFAR